MSFILDALRKSETERQNAQVPGIGDAPMVVHQKQVPKWAVGMIAGLSACLVILGWFWLRESGTSIYPDAAGPTASSTLTITGDTAAPAHTPIDGAGASVAASAGAAGLTTRPADPVAAMAPVSRPAGEVRDLSVEARQVTVGPGPAGSGSPTAQTSVTPAMSDPIAAPMLTLAQYRASGGALPELNLELHVYSPIAAERFVFINSSKYVEGQTLTEGPRLGAITQDGAILIHQGQSLLLPRE